MVGPLYRKFKIIMKTKRNSSLTLATLLLLATGALPFLDGCSSKRTSTESSTEIHRNNDDGTTYSNTYNEPRASVEVTKTETTTNNDNHRGFFGIVGDIIALPFRAVASIL